MVAVGGDPAADFAEKRAALSFKAVVDLFLEEHVRAKRKSSTAVGYASLLATFAVPALGNRKAEAITRAEIAHLHDQLKDKPYQANRLLAVIGSLYTCGTTWPSSGESQPGQEDREVSRGASRALPVAGGTGAARRRHSRGRDRRHRVARGRRRAEIKASHQGGKPANVAIAGRRGRASPPDFHGRQASRDFGPLLGARRFGAWSSAAAGFKDRAKDDCIEPPCPRDPASASARWLVRH